MPKIMLANVNIVLLGPQFSPGVLEKSSLTPLLDKGPTNYISTPVFAMLEFPGGIQVILDENRFQAMEKGGGHPSGSKVPLIGKEFLRLAREPALRAVGCNFVITIDFAGGDGHTSLASLLERHSELSSIVSVESPKIGLKLFYPWGESRCTLTIEPHFRAEPAKNLYVDANYHTNVTSIGQATKAMDSLADAYDHIEGVLQRLLVLQKE